MTRAKFQIVAETNSDYTTEELKVFVSEILSCGKVFAMYDERADRDLADKMTEIIIFME